MREIYTLFLEKVWLKYISIPVFAGILYFIIRELLPTVGQEAGVDFYVGILISVVIFGYYLILTIRNNNLPYAPKNKQGVLFIISAEDRKAFKHVEHCLATRFQTLSETLNLPNLCVICIERGRLKKYNLASHEDCRKLLTKTNCLFDVQTDYNVDDIDHSENFEMRINYGFLHPRLKPESNALLIKEMSLYVSDIGVQNFSKKESIQVFNTTAQTLTYICEYFVGITRIWCKKLDDAISIFITILRQLEECPVNKTFSKTIIPILKNRIFECNEYLAIKELTEFFNTRDRLYLHKAKALLESANEQKPNTYGYFLDLAMLAILIDRDATKAAEYVSRCRQLNVRSDWRYSDAFLAAYNNANPLKIYRKYQVAFKSEYNMLDIADFIECIIEEEPEREALHLALALIYFEIGDSILMHQHTAKYIDWINDKDITKDIVSLLNDRIKVRPCLLREECNRNCILCQRHLDRIES